MDEPAPHRSPQVRAWLRLHHCPNVPARAAIALAERLGDAERALDASEPALRAALDSLGVSRRALQSASERAVARDLQWLDAGGDRHIVAWNDERYPALLREIPDPPLLLYIEGDPSLLGTTQLAVVGSRNPTPTGRELAARLAYGLAEAGMTVTSGLAIGIDAAAHRGALAATGATVAVTGTGLDRVYPARHRDLAEEIGRRGALVSEFPTGTRPSKHAFPRRNRLISGLSVGTLVVEAAKRSGSLITARLAGEQGREVFAVPGSVLSPMSRGCHALIRDGARLVETEADIFEELGLPSARRAPLEPAASGSASRLAEHMGYDPVTIDTLVQRSGLTAETVSSILLRMELEGVVEIMAGGRYIRVG